MKNVFSALILLLGYVNYAIADPNLLLTADKLPPDFEAKYDVYKNNIRAGIMQVSFKNKGEHLIYQSNTKPVGLATIFASGQEIIDYSELYLIDGSYKTTEFKHEVKNSKKNRNEHYQFDWKENKADVSYKDRNSIVDISPFTLDNYSSQLLLMREPNTESTEITFPVISKGRLKEYVFSHAQTEDLETALGTLAASKYVRTKDNDKNSTYFGWYAKSLHHIPIRLDKYENGKIDTSIRIIEVTWPDAVE